MIDRAGSAQTSSTRNPGYGIDEYFYVSSLGGRTKLKLQGVEDTPNDLVHDFTYQSAPREVTLFFVGPRAAVKTTAAGALLTVHGVQWFGRSLLTNKVADFPRFLRIESPRISIRCAL